MEPTTVGGVLVWMVRHPWEAVGAALELQVGAPQRYFELYDDIYSSWLAASTPAQLPRLDAHVIRE